MSNELKYTQADLDEACNITLTVRGDMMTKINRRALVPSIGPNGECGWRLCTHKAGGQIITDSSVFFHSLDAAKFAISYVHETELVYVDNLGGSSNER
jgi:hypothetical protein